jgi:hypothetical protein
MLLLLLLLWPARMLSLLYLLYPNPSLFMKPVQHPLHVSTRGQATLCQHHLLDLLLVIVGRAPGEASSVC